MMRWAAVIVAVVVLLVLVVGSSALFEFLDSSDIMVIQYPSGTLRVATQPGIYGQWWGSVTKYKKRDQLWFGGADQAEGQKICQGISIRFNDGGHAQICGSIAWEMPVDEKNAIALHTRYRSHSAIEQQLVKTVIEKAVYMTGPLMTSVESYAARRNELLSLIDDQIIAGVYRTESQQEKVKDMMTGIEKTVTVVRIIKGADGHPLRQDNSPLDEFGVKTFNLAINRVPYDEQVEKQIKQQQEATMQVQTAIARAKESEQEAISVAKKGEADAARAKWEQEVIKAKEVTAAEQRKRVAELDAQAAEQVKRKLILEGEGEAAKRQLIMSADGALDKKLDAYVKINEKYAEAIHKYQGAWVPQIVTGGGNGTTAGLGAQQMIDMLTLKAAKDLGLDMRSSGQERTARH